MAPRLKFLGQGASIAATLVFLANTLAENWHQVLKVPLTTQHWGLVPLTVTLALLSYGWQGVLWAGNFRDLHYQVPWTWSLVNFLVLEIAKYLPGGVWQDYARIRAAHAQGVPVQVGTGSLVLQTIYTFIAALGLGLLTTNRPQVQAGCCLALTCFLVGLHPQLFNRVLAAPGRATRWVSQARWQLPPPLRLRHYPWRSIFGNLLFMGLRGLSFLVTILIFTPIPTPNLIPLLGGFSLAWGLGLVFPGAPGGVGIFESAAVLILEGLLPPQVLIWSVIVYRLVSITTEVLGVLLGCLLSQLLLQKVYGLAWFSKVSQEP